MKKLLDWCKGNLLFIFSLFLLAFIPLYPKLPLINIQHVWVYVRLEDFLVLFVILYWVILVLRKKVILRTPLTLPILIFWLIGAVSTLHALIFIFPDLANVFPNVAFLSYLRHIEYISLFFIAYSSMKDKRFFPYFVGVLVLTVLAVIVYGIGQKYFTFPAFLTMNEQFAKGVAIQLSALSRVSSTFGGQYDLAAYLVLTLPIIVSLIFGYRNWFLRIALGAIAALGLFVLFMTVSRIAVIAIFAAFLFVLLMQKKKLVIISIPVMAVAVILILSFSPGLLARFGNTVKEINVLVDAQTGDPIGQLIIEPKEYFKDKIVKQQNFTSIEGSSASPSAEMVIPYDTLPPQMLLYVQPNAPTGENLPQGTAYINLSLSPISQRTWDFYYESKDNDPKTGLPLVTIINGKYLVKKALAYDLSFTTRFQGEWPNAMTAFKRNIIFGSGYGSVSLAVDNNYLRTLAEVGALGFVSFLSIIAGLLIYLKKIFPLIDSRPVKSFMIGFCGGIIGLAINAIFIDVFEASKVAFVFWLMAGMVMATLKLYQKLSNSNFDFFSELKKVVTSTWAVISYLLITAIALYSPMIRNYFVGDDFTWFRWAASCNNAINSIRCPVTLLTIVRYFTDSVGFFYRPGAKIYYLLMYNFFWLNQNIYHIVSLSLHFLVATLVYLIARKIFKNNLLSAMTGFLFLTLTGSTEAVFWISATGFLFTTCFTLASLYTYILWTESKKKLYFTAAVALFVLSLLFHELGVVTPFLILLYQWIFIEPISIKRIWKNIYYLILFLPIPVYLLLRLTSHSLWMSGDYSYNLLKLPLNLAGNTLGYFFLTLIGPLFLPVYDASRNILKTHSVLALIMVIALLLIVVVVFKKLAKIFSKEERKIISFGFLFFLISLLPFLGLGNLTSRYSYLASVGILILFVFFIRKMHEYLLNNGQEIAIIISALVLSVFSLWQVVSLSQAHGDWFESGEMVRRFFVSIETVYDDSWKSDAMEFHFVNVPIRHGQAWVFPVGMPDALWFVIRNPNLKIYSWPTLKEAYGAVQYNSQAQKIFVFEDNGVVDLTIKPRETQ